MEKTIILGAGPAGLAAAWRLACASAPVLVVERERSVGGLCRSLKIDGCTFDIGPHLFKPRSEEVAALWDLACGGDYAIERNQSSRIYCGGGLHRSKADAILAQPWWKIARMGAQLGARMLRPGAVNSAEDLLRNMRGEGIYRALYKPHEEKLWGAPMSQIDSTFYATQTTDLSSSLPSLLVAALRSRLRPAPSEGEADHGTGESDVTFRARPRFPSRGSGALYDRIRELAAGEGDARFLLGTELVAVEHSDGRVRSVVVRDRERGEESRIEGTNFVSTIPLQVLVRCLDPPAEESIVADAARLFHRDLVSVSLVLEPDPPFPHGWIDAFSEEVRLFRITHFSGLSPGMAGHAGRQPVGVEYYCFRNDELWQRSDSALVELAIKELAAIGLMSESNVISGQVERLQEACPVHIVGYREITKRLLDNLAELQNLQSVGRNGLFTYNQMSHSVDCGLRAAENVLGANHRIEPPGAGESVVF